MVQPQLLPYSTQLSIIALSMRRLVMHLLTAAPWLGPDPRSSGVGLYIDDPLDSRFYCSTEREKCTVYKPILLVYICTVRPCVARVARVNMNVHVTVSAHAWRMPMRFFAYNNSTYRKARRPPYFLISPLLLHGTPVYRAALPVYATTIPRM